MTADVDPRCSARGRFREDALGDPPRLEHPLGGSEGDRIGEDVTPELARASGFKGVVDLLKTAKHGRGENVYLVRFHYVPPAAPAPSRPSRPPSRKRAARK